MSIWKRMVVLVLTILLPQYCVIYIKNLYLVYMYMERREVITSLFFYFPTSHRKNPFATAYSRIRHPAILL